MAKTDWRFTDTVIPEDLNGIGEEINGLRTEISTRFDHADTTPLTLQPGLQVVHAEKDARFKLGEIRGRTLENLLGYHGNLDTLNNWYVVIGTGNAQGRIATVTGNGTGRNPQMQSLFSLGPKPAIGDKFFLTAKIRVDSPDCTALRIYLYVNSIGIQDGGRVVNPEVGKEYIVSGIVTVTQEMIDVWDTLKFVVSAWYSNDTTANNSVTKFWDLAMYPVPTVDHSLTNEELQGKYPYTNGGITGIDNPYVINTSVNLLPPFYEWTLNANAHILNPYELNLSAYNANQYSSVTVSCFGGQRFTFSGELPVGTYIQFIFYDENGVVISDQYSHSVIAPNEAIKFTFVFQNDVTIGEFVFKNPMLTIGTDPQPFTPQRKSMLAFDTELHANPDTGADPDILFEQNGQYFKLAKWKKVVLDGSLDWTYGSRPTGYKVLRLPAFTRDLEQVPFMTKYNGAALTYNGGAITGADQFRQGSGETFMFVTVSNEDSGWGDDYAPTQDEIKAYFSGWTMAHLDGTVPYEPDNVGIHGAKVWIPTLGFNGANGSTTIQFSPSPYAIAAGWSPYNLLYRLAKETVEPVVTEGSLLLSEGDNMVDVGTGIVLRERANPKYYATGNSWFVNNGVAGWESTHFKNKPRKLLSIYKDSRRDSNWLIETISLAYGNERAYIGDANYDSSAAYSVTYIKLDKSPIQTITGALVANEKAQISDLTAGVAEALQRVSVVEMKKTEKDYPGWIGATLLNGGTGSVKYRKFGSTLYVGGALFTGAKIAGTVLFRLPEEYAPKTVQTLVLATYDSGVELQSVVVDFHTDGSVKIASDAKLVVIFNSVSVSLDWR